jgi:hypothetical protein
MLCHGETVHHSESPGRRRRSSSPHEAPPKAVLIHD